MSAVLRDRNTGLGASDAAPALGLPEAFRTPFELWQEKSGHGPAFVESLPVMVGRALEPVTRTLFMQKTGLIVTRAGEQIVDPSNNWRWVTLDGWCSDGALLEAKAISWTGASWGEPGTDQVPIPYLVQCQHGMACTGAFKVYVPVLFDGKRFEVYVVERDEEVIRTITAAEYAFWQRVVNNDPPPILTTNDAKLKYARSEESSVIATPEVLDLVLAIRAQKEALAAAELTHDTTKAKVMEFMGESAVLVDSLGKQLVTWRTGKGRLGIDSDAVRRDHGTKYDKQGAPSRPFLVKK